MRITVNGQELELQDGATVSALVATLSLPATRVAVERNRELVRRADHAQTTLCEGDTLEVVTLVGGG
jgi:thiamine biosynthesis protein ThiS